GVANPDRMKRRQLRLLRAVARIEMEECDSEASALVRESELLRSIRPRFNRAGTWPGKQRFLVWRAMDGRLEMAVSEQAESGWECFGPMSSAAINLRNALGRLIWLAMPPESPIR